MTSSSFSAPWSIGVKLVTSLVCLILSYYIVTFFYYRTEFTGRDFVIRLVVALCVLGCGLVFMINRYSVDSAGIVIHRLLWHRRVRREDIAKVTAPSLSMARIGLCGLWGFCGYSGFAYSGTLGFHFVAASSGGSRRVVISRRHGLPVLISPADPEGFVQAFLDASPDAALRAAS